MAKENMLRWARNKITRLKPWIKFTVVNRLLSVKFKLQYIARTFQKYLERIEEALLALIKILLDNEEKILIISKKLFLRGLSILLLRSIIGFLPRLLISSLSETIFYTAGTSANTPSSFTSRVKERLSESQTIPVGPFMWPITPTNHILVSSIRKLCIWTSKACFYSIPMVEPYVPINHRGNITNLLYNLTNTTMSTGVVFDMVGQVTSTAMDVKHPVVRFIYHTFLSACYTAYGNTVELLEQHYRAQMCAAVCIRRLMAFLEPTMKSAPTKKIAPQLDPLSIIIIQVFNSILATQGVGTAIIKGRVLNELVKMGSTHFEPASFLVPLIPAVNTSQPLDASLTNMELVHKFYVPIYQSLKNSFQQPSLDDLNNCIKDLD